MSKTYIKTCTCVSPMQDKMYGDKKRVMNKLKGGDKDSIRVRCTVCSTVH